MYDYKTLVDPGNARKPRFPSPQGFKFRTDDIKNTCCWLWLIDSDTEDPETMDKFEVENNAKLVGQTRQGEHWSSVKKFPFLQTGKGGRACPATPYYYHADKQTSVLASY